jgi:hypothetical protein
MTVIARSYVIRRCPECHGQVGDSTVAHFNDCPNTYVAFMPEEVLVPWPENARGAVEALREETRKEAARLARAALGWS